MDKIPTEFKLTTLAEIPFNAEDLSKQLTPLQVVELIKDLEEASDDWEITVLLARHFNALHSLAIKAHPELLGASDEELEAELLKQAAMDSEERTMGLTLVEIDSTADPIEASSIEGDGVAG